jgi:hypothetical protein
MAISLASAFLGPLPRDLQKPQLRPNRRLLRKQPAAKLPMRPEKRRILASRVAFGDRCARTAFELADVKFIDKKGGLGVRLRGKA